MNSYKINFTNRVTPETVSIKYKVILNEPESAKSITQFGNSAFQRFASPLSYFKTGQAAIQVIRQIVQSMDNTKYQLQTINFASSEDEKILGVPSKDEILAVISKVTDNQVDITVEHHLLLG
ncbi:hypothetical protein [Secundilactobacillus kimchicus]|nr:hypothetical protein [Secundilactobacillus kimchicus]